MERTQNLLSWAEDQGIALKGITPRNIPGRGIGIVATRTLKVATQTMIGVLVDLLSRKGKSS
jgi:hypothetical protein